VCGGLDRPPENPARPAKNPGYSKDSIGFQNTTGRASRLSSCLSEEVLNPTGPCVQAEWILSFSCASTTPRVVVVNASLHLLSAVLHPA